MGYFTREPGRRIRSKPATGDGPELRVDIVVESAKIECLAEESRGETKLSFGAAVCLGFVECLLVDLGAEGVGNGGAFEDLVLAVGKVAV